MPIETLEALSQQCGELLQRRGWLLTTAESCTGGWVAQIITAIAGSSAWFERGFVTYSNEAKQDMLGVPSNILQQHGAVSEAVVLAMARGALQHSRAQVSIAISGIAGPTGGSATKPVGTVWIAWATPEQLFAKLFVFNGDRQQVREQAVRVALTELRQLLEISQR